MLRCGSRRRIDIVRTEVLPISPRPQLADSVQQVHRYLWRAGVERPTSRQSTCRFVSDQPRALSHHHKSGTVEVASSGCHTVCCPVAGIRARPPAPRSKSDARIRPQPPNPSWPSPILFWSILPVLLPQAVLSHLTSAISVLKTVLRRNSRRRP